MASSLPPPAAISRQSSHWPPLAFPSYSSTPLSIPLSSFPAASSTQATTPSGQSDALPDLQPSPNKYHLRSLQPTAAIHVSSTSPPVIPAPKRRHQDAPSGPQEAVTVIQAAPPLEKVCRHPAPNLSLTLLPQTRLQPCELCALKEYECTRTPPGACAKCHSSKKKCSYAGKPFQGPATSAPDVNTSSQGKGKSTSRPKPRPVSAVVGPPPEAASGSGSRPVSGG